MRRGDTLFAEGQFEEAAKRLATASAAPGFALADYATIRQADALAQLKKYAEAAAVYASVLEKFGTSSHAPRAALAGGKCYYLAGQRAEARRLLAEALKAGGALAAEAAHWTAKSWLEEGKPTEALAVLEPAVAQAGQTEFLTALLMDQADALYAIPERRKESIVQYAALVAQHPQDPLAPQAAYMAAFAALQEGLPDEALKHADAFVAAYAAHELVPDVMHVAAEARLLAKQWPEAESLYGQLLEKYGNHADANLWKVRRALTLQLQKKHAETVAALEPVVSGLGDADLKAEAQYLLGGSQLELGQVDAAIASLEASLKAQPKWRLADETLLLLASAYRRKDDVARALQTVARVISDFPNSQLLDRAHYRLGEYQYVRGDYAAAMAAYRQVIDGWPQSPLVPNALFELGCAQLSQKDAAGAEQTFTVLLEKYPESALADRARYARGMARQQQGKYQPAVDDLQIALAANPAGPARSDTLYVLGLALIGLKQYGAAAKTFQDLLAADPQYAGADNALYQLAWSLKLGDKEAEAADVFAKLANGYPDSARAAEALYHCGEFALKTKDYAKAAVAYYTSMKKAGRSELGELASHKLGWAYYHQNDFENARKTFRYQQVTYPQGPLAQDAAFMEGECLFKAGNYAEALATYERIGGLRTPESEVLRLLHAGQAAAQLKDWQKSLELLTKCVQSFPDSPQAPEVLYEQAWALQNLDQVDKALPLYELVISKTNREVAARAQFMIGEIQFQRKDFNEAIKSFFKVTYGYGFPKWQAEAAFEAARCFEVLGKKDQALKLYQELLEKYPDSDKLPAARLRIEELQK